MTSRFSRFTGEMIGASRRRRQQKEFGFFNGLRSFPPEPQIQTPLLKKFYPLPMIEVKPP